MPPTPQDPQEPKEETKKDPFDLGQILLPKKETPGQTPQSAQRINAGVLLEQEQSATLLPDPAAPPTTPPIESAPAIAPVAPKEESVVKPIETYRGDIESVVKDQNLSVLSIASAEAERRGTQSGAEPTDKTTAKTFSVKTIGLYALGFLLLLGASGALAYIIERPTSVGIPQSSKPTSPFIAVDDTKEITITTGPQTDTGAPATTRPQLLSSLTAAKQATALSLGLISQLVVSVASSTPSGTVLNPLDAQTLFTLIAPNMPPTLLRSIRPTYLLGVHIYKNNEPFFILSVDSYEQAYAGMLAWEPYMQQDLAPLFTNPAPIHIPEQNAASTTPAQDTQFIQTGFVDSVVENHDARVVQNSDGDISLLWTFLDRNTLVITTDPTTVREIISRIKNAPITSIPTK